MNFKIQKIGYSILRIVIIYSNMNPKHARALDNLKSYFCCIR